MRQWFAAALLVVACAARAGEATAVITGYVRAEIDMKPLASYRITIDHTHVTTDADGRYRVTVAPGQHYIVTAYGRIFSFTIAAGQTLRFDVYESFAVCDCITVTSSRLPENDDAPVELATSHRELDLLPVGRTIADVARLGVGTIATGAQTSSFDSLGPPRLSVDGVRFDYLRIPLDFAGATNVITADVPLALNSNGGGVVLASTRERGILEPPRATMFTYVQPRANNVRSADLGVTAISAVNERLWLAGGVDVARSDFRLALFAPQRSNVLSYFGRAEWQAARGASVTGEALGDPGRETYDNGHVTEIFRGFVNASQWLAELSASHTHVREAFTHTSDPRVRAAIERLGGAHTMGGGIDVEQFKREWETLREGSVWLSDTWQPTPDLVATAGLRYTANHTNLGVSFGGGGLASTADPPLKDRHALLPHANVIWRAANNLRAFATWARYAEGLLPSPLLIFARTNEVTAGVETMNLGARVIHRSTESDHHPLPLPHRSFNGLLLTAAMRDVQLSYLLASRSGAETDIVGERRHQLQLLATQRFGAIEGGAIAHWFSSGSLARTPNRAPSLVTIDAHLGVGAGNHVTFVADVFNILGRHTPSDFNGSQFTPTFPYAYLAPRTVRFGVRAAL